MEKKIQDYERISTGCQSGKKRKIQDDESITMGCQSGKKRKIQDDDQSITTGCQSGKKRKIQDEEYEDELNYNFVPRKKMKIDKPFEINMDDYVKTRRDLLIYI